MGHEADGPLRARVRLQLCLRLRLRLRLCLHLHLPVPASVSVPVPVPMLVAVAVAVSVRHVPCNVVGGSQVGFISDYFPIRLLQGAVCARMCACARVRACSHACVHLSALACAFVCDGLYVGVRPCVTKRATV